MDGRIKLRHLQCFLAVARHRSIQRAAAALSITQPAVSKTLKELELILDVPLFERSRRGALPTRHAELFLRHAGASVGALREGLQTLARAREAGHVRVSIGALPTVAPGLLSRALIALGREMPGLPLRVVTGSNDWLLQRLMQAEVELVVGRLAEPASMIGLSFEHLYAEPLVLVARSGHPLFAPGEPVIERLTHHPLVLPMPGTLIRQAADSFMAGNGLALPPDTIETLSVSLGRSLARHGDAVWFVSLDAVEDDLADGRLQRLPVATGGTEEPLGLIVRSDGLMLPALQSFAAIVRRLAAARRAAAGTG